MELEQEKAAHEVDSRRVQELSNFAEQLQSVKAELEQESTELKSDKQELVLKTERLLEQQVELHNSASSLKTENKILLQQVSFIVSLQPVQDCVHSFTADMCAML